MEAGLEDGAGPGEERESEGHTGDIRALYSSTFRPKAYLQQVPRLRPDKR